MTTAKTIFNYIQGINPSVSTISSMGSFVTELSQQVADKCLSEVISNLPVDSLAYKIATNNLGTFTEKQLWVIAFELDKNESFVKLATEFYNSINRKEAAKQDKSKAKLAANKEASADILAPIKSAKKIGEFGKWLNNSKNPFRKQHFTKAYTQEAVQAYLQTI